MKYKYVFSDWGYTLISKFENVYDKIILKRKQKATFFFYAKKRKNLKKFWEIAYFISLIYIETKKSLKKYN